MPSFFRKKLNTVLQNFGYELTKIENDPYGIRWLNDIKKLCSAYHKKINIAFDVGANVGTTSIEMLECSHSVYSFECHPVTFKKLECTLAGTKAQAFEIALSDVSGSKVLYDYGELGYINSLSPNARYAVHFKKKASQLQVTTTTIDDFCTQNSISKIDILKIDTEGHDFNVLKGAERMLRNNSIAFIYFEFNDFIQEKSTNGGSLNEITEYLSSFGFQFIATYTDYIVTEKKMFVVANALLFNPTS
jgi:FkbM family methyltransferase